MGLIIITVIGNLTTNWGLSFEKTKNCNILHCFFRRVSYSILWI